MNVPASASTPTNGAPVVANPPVGASETNWVDFNWVPDLAEPAPAFTTHCLSSVDGTAHAEASAMYASSDATAYANGTLQGSTVCQGQFASASSGGTVTMTDGTGYMVPTDLSGGAGGQPAVRIVLTIGLSGAAQATANSSSYSGSSSSCYINTTHKVNTTLVPK